VTVKSETPLTKYVSGFEVTDGAFAAPGCVPVAAIVYPLESVDAQGFGVGAVPRVILKSIFMGLGGLFAGTLIAVGQVCPSTEQVNPLKLRAIVPAVTVDGVNVSRKGTWTCWPFVGRKKVLGSAL
jgi:hypothetical protein